MKRFWIRRGLFFALMGALFLTLGTLAVMGLWNWLVPTLFGGPVIAFGQALGLLVLSRILFGGWGGRRYGGPGRWRGGNGRWAEGRERNDEWRQKMAERADQWRTMTPQERWQAREQMRQEWREGCGPGRNRRDPQPEAGQTDEPTPPV